jgi:predicted acetyltransferase
VAVLWASEGRIYQRFGYGLATRKCSLDIEAREIALNAPRAAESRIRVDYPHELRKEAMAVYEAAVPSRPGFASRPGNWWDFLFADPPSRRNGGGRKRLAIHEGPSGPDGYAMFRVKSSWDSAGPNGEVIVMHLVANNPVAYRELWRFLLDVDLTRSVTLVYGSVDEPLFEMVNEPRRLRAGVTDGLWLRVLDVPAALAARRYPAAADLVIEVTDTLIPENNGRFDLSGVRVSAPADLAMDVATLGNVYLGGGSVGALEMAGRVRELRRGAVAQADAAFRWHRAPVGLEMF